MAAPALERDPVCGMMVGRDTPHQTVHEGRPVYFCRAKCREAYEAQVAGGMQASAPPLPPPAGASYVCPMDPEVRSDRPGACPKCGMALEPRTPSAADEDPALRDMTRRFWISAILSLPMVVVGMAEFLPDNPFMPIMHAGWFNWAELALATPVVLWGGWRSSNASGPRSGHGTSTCSRSSAWA